MARIAAIPAPRIFRRALFLARDDGTVMAIDLADTLDHLRANEKHGLYQAEVAKFRSRIVGHPPPCRLRPDDRELLGNRHAAATAARR
jgi:hypothetical protein